MLTWKNYFISAVIVIAIYLLLIPFPANNLWWREAFNYGHTLLFIFLSIALYCQIKLVARSANVFIIFLAVLVIGMLLGILIEALQSLTERDASLVDLYRNFIGIVTGFFLIATFIIKDIQGKKLITFIYMLVACALLLIGVMPLMQLSWHYIERNKAFPNIVNFGANWSSSFIGFNNAELLAGSEFSQNNNDGLYLLRLNKGEFPGISVKEPERDWSGYYKLRLSVYSENERDITMVLRVHDGKHNQLYADRFNQKLTIKPGLNEIAISLNQIKNGPVNRALDMTDIAGIILFSHALDESLIMKVSNIFLE